MFREARDLKLINPLLVKKLQKYLLSSTILIIFVVFGYQLFIEDTYAYYNQLSNDVILSESSDNQTEETLPLLVKTLNENGIKVKDFFSVYGSTITINAAGKTVTKKVHIADSFDYSEQVMERKVKWLFKNESLSNTGIYLDETTYKALGKPTEVEVLDREDRVFVYQIEGVYQFDKKPNFIFYSANESTSIILIHSNFLTEETKIKLTPHFFIRTERRITKEDLKLINHLFDTPDTALDNLEQTKLINTYITKSLERMVLVLVILIILITSILIYQYVLSTTEILLIWFIYYKDIKKIFLTAVMSVLIHFLAPCGICIVIFMGLMLFVQLYLNYIIAMPLFMILGFCIFIAIVAILMYIIKVGIILKTKKDYKIK